MANVAVGTSQTVVPLRSPTDSKSISSAAGSKSSLGTSRPIVGAVTPTGFGTPPPPCGGPAGGAPASLVGADELPVPGDPTGEGAGVAVTRGVGVPPRGVGDGLAVAATVGRPVDGSGSGSDGSGSDGRGSDGNGIGSGIVGVGVGRGVGFGVGFEVGFGVGTGVGVGVGNRAGSTVAATGTPTSLAPSQLWL